MEKIVADPQNANFMKFEEYNDLVRFALIRKGFRSACFERGEYVYIHYPSLGRGVDHFSVNLEGKWSFHCYGEAGSGPFPVNEGHESFPDPDLVAEEMIRFLNRNPDASKPGFFKRLLGKL